MIKVKEINNNNKTKDYFQKCNILNLKINYIKFYYNKRNFINFKK